MSMKNTNSIGDFDADKMRVDSLREYESIPVSELIIEYPAIDRIEVVEVKTTKLKTEKIYQNVFFTDAKTGIHYVLKSSIATEDEIRGNGLKLTIFNEVPTPEIPIKAVINFENLTLKQ